MNLKIIDLFQKNQNCDKFDFIVESSSCNDNWTIIHNVEFNENFINKKKICISN